MNFATAQQINFPRLLKVFLQTVFVVFLMLSAVYCLYAQQPAADEKAVVIEDTTDGDVFGLGKSVVVKGAVKKGVIALGGDVIVEGRVEGDVATIGGSVYQRENSFIGGDVIVFGGAYHHGKTAPLRNPDSETIMYAGYEDELREAMQNPASLAAPHFSLGYLAQRLLAALFWFVLSLIFVTIAPGAVSRAITRLSLTSLRVAIIGGVSLIVATLGVTGGLFLPSLLGVAVVLMMSALLFLAYVFGRVSVQAATGKWLQKRLFGDRHGSESTALLLGAVFWTFVLSLPYLWALALVGLLVVSLGIVLTARPALGRRQR